MLAGVDGVRKRSLRRHLFRHPDSLRTVDGTSEAERLSSQTDARERMMGRAGEGSARPIAFVISSRRCLNPRDVLPQLRRVRRPVALKPGADSQRRGPPRHATPPGKFPEYTVFGRIAGLSSDRVRCGDRRWEGNCGAGAEDVLLGGARARRARVVRECRFGCAGQAGTADRGGGDAGRQQGLPGRPARRHVLGAGAACARRRWSVSVRRDGVSHRIVGAASERRVVVALVQRPTLDAKARPAIRYRRTRLQPITDQAGRRSGPRSGVPRDARMAVCRWRRLRRHRHPRRLHRHPPWIPTRTAMP